MKYCDREREQETCLGPASAAAADAPPSGSINNFCFTEGGDQQQDPNSCCKTNGQELNTNETPPQQEQQEGEEEDDPRGRELEELRQRAMVSRRTSLWNRAETAAETAVNEGIQYFDNSYQQAPKQTPHTQTQNHQPPQTNTNNDATTLPLRKKQQASVSTPRSSSNHNRRSFISDSECDNYPEITRRINNNKADRMNGNGKSEMTPSLTRSWYGGPAGYSVTVAPSASVRVAPMLVTKQSYSCTSSPSPLRRDARLVFQVVDHQHGDDIIISQDEAADSRQPEPPPPPPRPSNIGYTSNNNNNNSHQHRRTATGSNGENFHRSSAQPWHNAASPPVAVVAAAATMTSASPAGQQSNGHHQVPTMIMTSSSSSRPHHHQSTSAMYSQQQTAPFRRTATMASSFSDADAPTQAVSAPMLAADPSSVSTSMPATYQSHPDVSSADFKNNNSNHNHNHNHSNNHHYSSGHSPVQEPAIERRSASAVRGMNKLPSYPQPTVTLLKTMRQKREETPPRSATDFFTNNYNNGQSNSNNNNGVVHEVPIVRQQSQRPSSASAAMAYSKSAPMLAAQALEAIDSAVDGNKVPSSWQFVQEPRIIPIQHQPQKSHRSPNAAAGMPFQVPLGVASPATSPLSYEKKDATTTVTTYSSSSSSSSSAVNNNSYANQPLLAPDKNDQRGRLRDRLERLIDDLHQLDASIGPIDSSSSSSPHHRSLRQQFVYRGAQSVPIVFNTINGGPAAFSDMSTSSRQIPITTSSSSSSTPAAADSHRQSPNNFWSQQQQQQQQQPFRISSLAAPARSSSASAYRQPIRDSSLDYAGFNSSNGYKSNKSVHWDSAVLAGGEDTNINNNSIKTPLYSPRSIDDYEPGKSSIINVEAAATASRANRNNLFSFPTTNNSSLFYSGSSNSKQASTSSTPTPTPTTGHQQPVPVVIVTDQAFKSSQLEGGNSGNRTPLFGANFTSSPLPYSSTSSGGNRSASPAHVPPGREEYVRVQSGGEVPEWGFRRPCVNSSTSAGAAATASPPSAAFFSPASPAPVFNNGSRPNSGVYSRAPSTSTTPSPFSRNLRFGSVRLGSVTGGDHFQHHENRFFSDDSSPYMPLPPPDSPADVAKRKAFLLKATADIRRRKASQSAADTASRRHNDFYLPGQKTLLPARNPLSSTSVPTSPALKSGGGPFVGRACKDFFAVTQAELPLRHGDIVQVLRRVNTYWLEGYRQNDDDSDRRLGIFPSTHVKPLPKDHDCILAEARFDFVAEAPLELSFSKGDLIAVVRRVDEKWYAGRLGLAEGIFPSSYVRLLSDPPASFFAASSASSAAVSPTPPISSPVPVFSPLPTSGRPHRQLYTPQPFDTEANNGSINHTGGLGGANGTVDNNKTRQQQIEQFFPTTVVVSSRPPSIIPDRDRYCIADDVKIEARTQWFLERTADPNGAIALTDLDYEKYEVAFDHDPNIGDEIELRRGEIIQVVDDVVTADYSSRRMVLARKEDGQVGICPYDCLRRL